METTERAPALSTAGRTGGVQSVHRALDLVEVVAARGGHLGVAEIAAATRMPLPTTHRLLQTLVDRGYMRQLRNRRYALGFRLVPLGSAASATVGADALDLLAGLVAATGETANLAVRAGDRAEYVAQVPSRHTMRTFTEVGRRVDLHSTGVGKAMLARLADDEVRRVVRPTGLGPRTAHTLTTEAGLLAALDDVRARGYALDDEEQELGVRCVAVAVGDGFSALSVSGPLTRMDDDVVAHAVPLLQAAAERLADDRTPNGPNGAP